MSTLRRFVVRTTLYLKPNRRNNARRDSVFVNMSLGTILWVMWNGMLATIPVGAGYALRSVLDRKPLRVTGCALALALGLIWLIFLPNTCYLLTEWRHYLDMLDSQNLFLRAKGDNVLFIKLTLGTMFYFLYSLFGMAAFAMAIRPVERAALRRGIAVRFWALPFFAAVALGVYLGLVLRFNSWDAIGNPAMVWEAIVEVGGRPKLAAFILAFGGFLWVAYEVLDIWIDGLKQRLAAGKSDA
jgi:uncharacterized membrane protein